MVTYALVVLGFIATEGTWPIAGRVLMTGITQEQCMSVRDAMKVATEEPQGMLTAACVMETPLEEFTFEDGSTYTKPMTD